MLPLQFGVNAPSDEVARFFRVQFDSICATVSVGIYWCYIK